MADRISLLLLANPSCLCFDILLPLSFRNPNLLLPRSHLLWSSQSAAITIHFAPTKGRWLTRRFSYERGGGGEDDGDEDGGGGGGSGRNRVRRKRKRRWWSDQSEDVHDDGSSGILDQIVENLWIFKVFKSYGYFLPFILLSFLTATGPKAFLMASALAVGLSALILAFEKVWGNDKPKTKTSKSYTGRTRRKPFTRNASNFGSEEDENEETEEKTGYYPSWVEHDDDGSARGAVGKESGFGGWDELDPMETFTKPGQFTPKPGREPIGKGKNWGSSKRERKEPLLLRLLVAIFPFLGSWTNMLW